MSELVELIKVLRDRTGAGMMDCKHALEANANDIEKSIDWLREKGIAKNAKKEGRIAAEGLTNIKIDGNKALIIEVNCETDFVTRAEPFIKLVHDVTDICFAVEPKDVDALKAAKNAAGVDVTTMFNEAGVKLGEKLSLRRFQFVTKKDDEIFGSYIHSDSSLAILATVKGGDQAFADTVSMCIASNNPAYASIKDVPAAEFADEKRIQIEAAKEDPTFAKKPAQIQDKILEGRVQKHFETQVFGFGEYVLDSTKNMDQVMKENKAELVSFIRYKVGEGIEKKQEDFAAEVAKQRTC